MTYVIAEPCIDIKDRSCVDVCPVDCIHEAARMLVIDPEECIDCGACEPECPVEAIFPEDALPEKWEPFVKINYAFPEGMDGRPARRRVRRPSSTSRTDRRLAQALGETVGELPRLEPPAPVSLRGSGRVEAGLAAEAEDVLHLDDREVGSASSTRAG